MSLNNHHNLYQKHRPLAGPSGCGLFAGNGSWNVGIYLSWMVVSHVEIDSMHCCIGRVSTSMYSLGCLMYQQKRVRQQRSMMNLRNYYELDCFRKVSRASVRNVLMFENRLTISRACVFPDIRWSLLVRNFIYILLHTSMYKIIISLLMS